jgi:uncharacterized protein (TIGR02678 family)
VPDSPTGWLATEEPGASTAPLTRATPRLQEHLEAERTEAVRRLLAKPLLDGAYDPGAFRLVARHTAWLTEYFEQACGWVLTVDTTSAFARLWKRPAAVDTTRPLRRTRGDHIPFDRRRYQLLCLVCAELVRHPVTTIGMLAGAVTPDAGLDTSRQAERSAFVDALRALIGWGALEVSAGELDAYVGSDGVNALLAADLTRVHRLLVPTAAPSSLPAALSVEEAADQLLHEPRYGTGVGEAPTAETGEEARNRWARHRLGRRLLDDPVVYLEDLSDVEIAYLSSISGRRWLRERAAGAGLEIEERAEGFLAVDPDAIATDERFPAPAGNVHQLALLLADRLVAADPTGSRRLVHLSVDDLGAAVQEVLDRFPGWARGQRDEGGPERLARQAADLLVAFGLARRDGAGGIEARPALARYRTAPAVVSGEATLFEARL